MPTSPRGGAAAVCSGPAGRQSMHVTPLDRCVSGLELHIHCTPRTGVNAPVAYTICHVA